MSTAELTVAAKHSLWAWIYLYNVSIIPSPRTFQPTNRELPQWTVRWTIRHKTSLSTSFANADWQTPTEMSTLVLVTSSGINLARVWQPTLTMWDDITNNIYEEHLPGVYSAERNSDMWELWSIRSQLTVYRCLSVYTVRISWRP
jgi:hypothetical protein